jgi:SAM-dependent methyltransferase
MMFGISLLPESATDVEHHGDQLLIWRQTMLDDFFTGPSFYDNEDVFTRYQSHRDNRPDNPNDTLEKPIIQELIGDPAGLKVLDLGCGDARFGQEMLSRGAGFYLGVDGSSNMIAAAQKNLAETEGLAILGNLESWNPSETAFDVVVSRLVLHYILQLDRLLKGVYQSLMVGGRLVFSVEHPVITSCNRSYPPGSIRQDWIVDDYFDAGPRTPIWMGKKVMKVHRTVEDYFLGLQTAGFIVESLRESRPRRELFASEETFQRRKRIPLFLLFVASRPK